MSRLRPVGRVAAVADINKGAYIQTYQSTMLLIVIDFTFLEGRGDDIVVKVLAVADCHINMVSSYAFKRPYGWEEIPMFNARMNQDIVHGCNWSDCDVPYSELETVLHREVSSAVAIYFLDLRKQTILEVLSTGQLLILLS